VIQNSCGNSNEPARQVWYTPLPGFRGIDKVTFPFSGGRTLIFNVRVR
jgi:hypothetical protein